LAAIWTHVAALSNNLRNRRNDIQNHAGAIAIIIHAIVGWALCGATICVGRKVTTLRNALIAHAIAAPIIFGAVSFVCFRWFGSTGPATTAAMFLAVVVFLDMFVIALLVERSFDMFRSILGTWLPFVLIFLAVWLTGTVMAIPS
jgi:hypothetical protein